MVEDFPNNKTDLIELYSLKSFVWLKAFLLTKEENSAYYGEIV